MIHFCPLASGSKGNAYWLKTDQVSLLIDVGISMRELERRLSLLNASLQDIDAILVTHEHHDHIAGLKSVTNAYSIPVLTNYLTAEAIVESIDDCPKFKIFTTGEPFFFRGVEIHSFSVQHDGIEPVGLTISDGQTKIGLCTDIGFMTKSVLHKLKDSHLLVLEANHQPDFVLACSRPDSYKRRVLGRLGHLSNQSCAEALRELAHSSLQQIYLAHLSSECNRPELAMKTVQDTVGDSFRHIPIDIALQDTLSKEWCVPKQLEA